MLKKKTKENPISQKFIKGMIIARKRMLEEKSLKGQYVIYSENGKIIKEKASVILERENKNK
ncbi:MAG TPA: hypothetical protein PKC58_16940 [Ignavibacteria bacterium]|nr:hypothetical protein [Ignavibacteria bacterium]